MKYLFKCFHHKICRVSLWLAQTVFRCRVYNMAEIGLWVLSFFPAGCIRSSAAAGEENKPQVPLLACSAKRQGACTLYGVRIGVCSGVRLRGVAQGFAHLMWLCMQGACTVPCFALKWQMGFGLFVAFGSKIFLNCASNSCFSLTPVSLSSVLGERCADASIAAESQRFSLSHFHQRSSPHYCQVRVKGLFFWNFFLLNRGHRPDLP